MNRWQKIAWFNLTVIVVSLLLAGAAIGTLAIIVGMPGALGGLGFLGLCGLLGLEPVLSRTKRGQSKVDFDERDLLISKKAALYAFTASYLFFYAACMVTWFVVGFRGTISVNLLPLIAIGGLITLMVVRSVAILVQYGGKGKSHE